MLSFLCVFLQIGSNSWSVSQQSHKPTTPGEPRGPGTVGGTTKQAARKGWEGNTRSQNWCWRLNLVKPQPRASSQEKVSSCWPALLFLTLQSPLWTLSWFGGGIVVHSQGNSALGCSFDPNTLGPVFQRTRNFPKCWHTKAICWGACQHGEKSWPIWWGKM